MLFFSALSVQNRHSLPDIIEEEKVKEEGANNMKTEQSSVMVESEANVEEMCRDFDEANISSSENSTLQGELDGHEESGESFNRFVDSNFLSPFIV